MDQGERRIVHADWVGYHFNWAALTGGISTRNRSSSSGCEWIWVVSCINESKSKDTAEPAHIEDVHCKIQTSKRRPTGSTEVKVRGGYYTLILL